MGGEEKAGEKIEARFFNVFKLFTFCTILCSIYTIALFIRVGADKILRCENIMVMYMYFIVLSVMSLGYILRQMNKTIIAMPTACFILFINACIPGGVMYTNNPEHLTCLCTKTNRLLRA